LERALDAAGAGRADHLVERRAAADAVPAHRGLVSGRCVNDGRRGYLSVRTHADPKDKRTDRIGGEVGMLGMFIPGWGMHLADMSIAQGDLFGRSANSRAHQVPFVPSSRHVPRTSLDCARDDGMTDFDKPYRGGFVELPAGGREHHFALTVYFEDTDTAGIVYYANYLKFMERARSDMIRAAGVDQMAELKASGSCLCGRRRRDQDIESPPISATTWWWSARSRLRAVSVTIHQRVMRGAELMTDAMVTAAFLTSDQRPQRQPREWVEPV
jgi:acyl-CoA thioester hydrolase